MENKINTPPVKEEEQKKIEELKKVSKPVAKSDSKKVLDSSQIIKSKPEEKRSFLEVLNSWILPIVSLIVLAVVSVLVLIPSANDTMATLDEIRSNEDVLDKYESKIETLKSISISEVNSSLQLASQVIKDNLEVAELASDVEALARNSDLETKSVSFSTSTSSTLDIPGFVGIISGPFTYSGTFSNISSFISDLSTQSPTIVAIREVSMSKSSLSGTEEESTWSANFMVDAFTTSKVENVTLDDPVSSSIDEELLEEIVERIEEEGSLN
jgi:TRAP-type uncharacterized transport system fused permease subunit